MADSYLNYKALFLRAEKILPSLTGEIKVNLSSDFNNLILEF